ncbi:MAG: enamine deaminase RidA (YjgF/YER057c/UK114 family) [Francisellaceae bacterium]|jgi:enamine deaminase RidA (YjgF/YER057c/UK114 family)
MIKRISTNTRMSQIVLNNDIAYLSGQVAKDSSKDITHHLSITASKLDSSVKSRYR